MERSKGRKISDGTKGVGIKETKERKGGKYQSQEEMWREL
jgi:hypothetical protein